MPPAQVAQLQLIQKKTRLLSRTPRSSHITPVLKHASSLAGHGLSHYIQDSSDSIYVSACLNGPFLLGGVINHTSKRQSSPTSRHSSAVSACSKEECRTASGQCNRSQSVECLVSMAYGDAWPILFQSKPFTV